LWSGRDSRKLISMSPAPLHILLVEGGSAPARQQLEQELLVIRVPGFAWELVDQLAAGIERLGQGGIDLVVLDLAISGRPDLNAFRQVQERAGNVPIVVLTTLEDLELGFQAVEAGAQDCFIKEQLSSLVFAPALRRSVKRYQLAMAWAERTRVVEAREAILRQLVSKAADGLLLVDHEGRVRLANPAARALLGRERLMGEPLGFDVPAASAPVEVRTDDGQTRAVEVRAAPMEWASETAHVLVLREAASREAAAPAAPEPDLPVHLSDEIRGPLATIRGRLGDWLAADGKAQTVQHELLTEITHQVDRLMSLGDSLPDLLRLEADRLELDLKEADLCGLVQEALESRRSAAEAKRVVLDFSPLAEPLPIRVDSGLLIKALVKLLDNAVRVSPEGSSIRVTVEPDERQLTVKVTDPGPGIAPKTLPRLFNKFAQARPEAGGSGGGAGLGLYVARKIIEAHRGQIGVESELGRGSTFFFTLPVEAADEARGAAGLSAGPEPEPQSLDPAMTPKGERRDPEGSGASGPEHQSDER
jgi:signal transduction histidine kinase